MPKPAWIKELLTSLIKGHRLMDPSAWAPPNPFLLNPLFEDLWINRMRLIREKVNEKKISFTALANALKGPACIRKEFRWAIWGMKLRQTSPKEILEIITFYKNILQAKAPADIFCQHSCFWHNPQEIKNIITQTNWQTATSETKKLIGQLSANCPPIVWSLYTDFFYHRAYELYGLYKNLNNYDSNLAPTDVLLIRQYGPFRAPEIWPHTKNFPINQINIKCIYNGLKGEFDYINHFTTKDNIPQKLKFYCVEVDGKIIRTASELKSINSQIIEMAVKQSKKYEDLDQEGLKKLTVMARYYALKELFDIADIDWKPGKDVLNRIMGKKLLNLHFHLSPNAQEQTKFWKEMFNPFTDLRSKSFLEACTELQSKFKN